ncbi:putative caffeoylshikimate esterase-like isoform X2 [Capsicum annuum]|nr:putative caffeoylshikimate esterase-like isoform X2 [Capsicum annuum]
MVKFEGISEELHKIIDADMDKVEARRRARDAFKDIQLSIDHCLFKMPHARLKMKESYEVNSRGLEIFSKSWLPETSPPKAMVYFCHGYGDTCTFFIEGIARKLASSGYGVFSMDYPGFGLSEGLHGYIPSFDKLVDDVIEHYSKAKDSSAEMVCIRADNDMLIHLNPGSHNLEKEPENSNKKQEKARGSNATISLQSSSIQIKFIKIQDQDRNIQEQAQKPLNSSTKNPEICNLPSFLFGQSMGGAVALKVHMKQPDEWTGAVLLAPMCKIADDMVPPWLVTQLLVGIAKFLPKQKLVPQQDLAELAFRDVKKREQAAYNVIAYKHKPRLRTALELLNTTQEIEKQLDKVSLPLLILHGENDRVTDPSISQALYEKASSSDKKLILYKDAYHALLEGEPDEIILRVLGDIISWLDEHTS